MTPRLAMDNYYVILYSMSAVVIALYLCFYIYLKAKKTVLLNLYILTQLMLILWTLAKVFKTAATNIHIRWLFIAIQYLGICFLGVFFVMFAYTYSTGKVMKKLHVAILSILPLTSFVIIITNPLHMKFYSFFDMYRDSFGSLFYAHQFIVYSYLLAGIILCAKDFRKQFGERKIQAALFAASILFPIIINLLYVFKILKLLFKIRLPMDITPISCIVSLFLFAIAALKYHFLDITPLAYKKALEQTSDAIMLVNTDGIIIEYNKALISLFGSICSLEQNQRALAFFDGMNEVMVTGNAVQIFNRAKYANYGIESITIKVNDSILHLKVVVEPITDRWGKHVGDLFRFVDHSIVIRLIDELYNKNLQLYEANANLEQRTEALRQLTATRVRNLMAKEVHDIMGHSVVLVVSMLEVELINIKKGDVASENIDNCINILKDGLKEIESSIRENTSEKIDNSVLFKSIDIMAEQIKYSGIGMEITVQGEPFELSSQHVENVYKICREAVTNAVRHGNADFINLIFRFSANGYDVYIIDNGNGCSSIQKGMGLSGIEERAREVGGTISYNSYVGEGFSIYLSVVI